MRLLFPLVVHILLIFGTADADPTYDLTQNCPGDPMDPRADRCNLDWDLWGTVWPFKTYDLLQPVTLTTLKIWNAGNSPASTGKAFEVWVTETGVHDYTDTSRRCYTHPNTTPPPSWSQAAVTVTSCWHLTGRFITIRAPVGPMNWFPNRIEVYYDATHVPIAPTTPESNTTTTTTPEPNTTTPESNLNTTTPVSNLNTTTPEPNTTTTTTPEPNTTTPEPFEVPSNA
eukprot:3935432-Rhodomonas_salina.2